MEDYPLSYDHNVDWATTMFEHKIRDLKKMGCDGHPSLVKIEQLIAAHNATNYDANPKWMYYTSNERIYNLKVIEDESVFKKIVEIVRDPAKENRLACMIRVCRVRLKSLSTLHTSELSLKQLYYTGCGQEFDQNMR